MADILDGVFTTEGNVLKLIAGPLRSQKILLEFERLLQRAREQSLPPKDIIDEAAKLDPELGKALQMIPANSPYFLAIIFFVVLLIKQCSFTTNLDIKLDVNQLWEQIASENQLDDPQSKKGDRHP